DCRVFSRRVGHWPTRATARGRFRQNGCGGTADDGVIHRGGYGRSQGDGLPLPVCLLLQGKGGIPMRTCDACGKPVVGGISMGGATVCRKCEPDIKAEINRLRIEGKPVSVIAIARS